MNKRLPSDLVKIHNFSVKTFLYITDIELNNTVMPVCSVNVPGADGFCQQENL
jgi:hypothetical protein